MQEKEISAFVQYNIFVVNNICVSSVNKHQDERETGKS
jgi:hypothetical protein